MKLQSLWLQRIPPTFLAMAARDDLCLCCGLATKRDRRLLRSKSCESVLPALLHLIEQVMFESGAESPTSGITECTPCLYLCKKCYGLLQRYSNLQNVLKVSIKQVIESGLVMSSSIIQPAGTKRPAFLHACRNASPAHAIINIENTSYY